MGWWKSKKKELNGFGKAEQKNNWEEIEEKYVKEVVVERRFKNENV